MASASGGREFKILLGLAELCKTAVPPRVQESVVCLEAALSMTPPNEESRVRRDTALLLLQQLGDKAGAKRHLERACQVQSSSDVQCDVIHHLAKLYQEEGNLSVAESLLKKGVKALRAFPHSHFRLTLQLAELLSNRGDYSGVANLLANGAQYAAQTGTPHSQILLLLNQVKWLMLGCQYSEAKRVLDVCGHLVRNYAGHNASYLTSIYLVFVLIHLLELGQVKEARVPLKELQNTVKLMTKKQTAYDDEVASGDILEWISTEHVFVLVYLVCVVHSLLSGSSEKATSYATRALTMIDQSTSGDPLLSKLKAHVLENVVVCRLIQGQLSAAIQEVEQIIVLCNSSSSLMKTHQSVIHTLLGLYSMTCGNLETANGQFMMALQTADAGLQFFVWLNQALMSLSSGNHAQFRIILESIAGSPLPESSMSLKTCVHFIRGVHSLFAGKQTEARHYLRDALLLANEHDLNRLTASVLLLLGHMFLSFGSVMEANDMILPAFQIASRIPDMHLQLWAASQMTDLYRVLKNEPKMIEARDSHSQFMHALSSEKAVAQQSRHHILIHWAGGPVENCVIPSSDLQHHQSPHKRQHNDEDFRLQRSKRRKTDQQLSVQQSFPMHSSHTHPHPHMSPGIVAESIPTLRLSPSLINKIPQQRLGHSVEDLVCSSGSQACVQPQSRPLTHYGEPLVNPHALIHTHSQNRLEGSPQPGYSYHARPQPAAIPQFQMVSQSSPLGPSFYGYPPASQGGMMHPGYFHPQYTYHQ